MKIPLPIIILIILINLLFSFSSENTTELIPESFDSEKNGKIVFQKYMIRVPVEPVMQCQSQQLFLCVIV